MNQLIGAYSSEEEARLAIERAKDQPGFRDFPEGFAIDRYHPNQGNWIRLWRRSVWVSLAAFQLY
jgi:hypothetical protein